MANSTGETYHTATEIIQLFANMTLKQVAQECGVTKQRIWQITQASKIQTIRQRQKSSKIAHKNSLCSCRYCGMIVDRKSANRKRYYCNDICRDLDLYVIFPCNYCYKKVKHRKYLVQFKLKENQQYKYYCSTGCYHLDRSKGKKAGAKVLA
jgi:hypothetical protein